MKLNALKYLALIFGILSALNGCNTEPDSNAIHEELQNLHNQLMMNSGRIIKNRMMLDTLYRSNLELRSKKEIADTTAEKKHIAILIEQLNMADTEMMDWMHNFNNDFKGTEAESLAYYKSEMIKVHQIDHRYDSLSKASDSVLNIYHFKPEAAKMNMEHHR